MTEEDIKRLSAIHNPNRVWFALCPNANLYIENTLPNVPMFLKNDLQLTIGTDSLASNSTLSVLDEMKVLAAAFPQLSAATLLTMATRNGAEFMNLPHLGTFTKGNKPGVIHLPQLTPTQPEFNAQTTVTRLI